MTHRELYERLCDFSDRVAEFVEPLLDRRATAHAADQLLRAASAAAANYRATNYARSHAEFRSRLTIALEETDEACHWLHRLQRRNVGPAAEVMELLAESIELARILGAAVRTAKRNAQRDGEETAGRAGPRFQSGNRRKRSKNDGR